MRILVLAAPLLALAGCVAPSRPAPAPAPAPAPPAAPAPTPPPPPAPSGDWRDWPLSAGDWRYRQTPGGSVASFGQGTGVSALELRCERDALVLTRAGATGPLTVRTTSTTKQLPAGPQGARLAARDPIVDAMGFSRGRFIVESGTGAPLVVPAWAEILRVAEDCRR